MSSTLYEDKYFLNSKDALEESLKENYVLAPNKQVKGLQICYYDGEVLKNAPKNCINVPFENFVKYFSKTKNRIPTEFCDKDNIVMYQLFKDSLLEVNKIIEKKIQKLEQKIKELKPNFQDKKLRVFAFGCRETVLIKYIVENIIEAAKRLGLEVYLHKQTNNMQSCSKLHYLKALYKFNPHMTININHLNNSFLNKYIYNFIWFQDQMPVLLNNERIGKRERDYFFHLTKGLGRLIKNLNLNSNLQSFCLNEKIYKPRKKIKKDKKIVFIGSSYNSKIEKYKNEEDFDLVLEDAITIFEKKSCLRGLKSEKSEIKYLMDKYSKSLDYINNIYGYLIRDYCIEKLCSINTDYEIEIYGYGFENNPIIKPYYKGVLEYGKNISKVYNSATYGFCPGGYILMQRTIECAFSGTTPLVLDVRNDNQDGKYNKKVEDGIEFFHIKDLEQTLKKKYSKKNFNFIKKNYSYMHFIKRCKNIINKELNK